MVGANGSVIAISPLIPEAETQSMLSGIQIQVGVHTSDPGSARALCTAGRDGGWSCKIRFRSA